MEKTELAAPFVTQWICWSLTVWLCCVQSMTAANLDPTFYFAETMHIGLWILIYFI